MRAWALWRRLDAPGHDACRLDDDGTGWRLHGTAVYGDNGVPARLDYEVACSDTWVTRDGRVHGWLGARAVELVIRRSPAGAWTLNGVAVPGLDECVDLGHADLVVVAHAALLEVTPAGFVRLYPGLWELEPER